MWAMWRTGSSWSSWSDSRHCCVAIHFEKDAVAAQPKLAPMEIARCDHLPGPVVPSPKPTAGDRVRSGIIASGYETGERLLDLKA
jgi:hypothetical protein